jgi:hypothetical protein
MIILLFVYSYFIVLLLPPRFILEISSSQVWTALILLSLCRYSTLRMKIRRNHLHVIGNYQLCYCSASETASIKGLLLYQPSSVQERDIVCHVPFRAMSCPKLHENLIE